MDITQLLELAWICAEPNTSKGRKGKGKGRKEKERDGKGRERKKWWYVPTP